MCPENVHSAQLTKQNHKRFDNIKSSNQQLRLHMRIRIVNNNVRLIGYEESLTGQRHDRVQTESQIATVDSCFDLVGSRQHGVASYMKLSIYSLNADDDDLRGNSNPNLCQLANVTCENADKGQQEKSRISCRCRDKETADRHKLSRRKNHGKTMLKMSSISDLKRPTAPKYTGQ